MLNEQVCHNEYTLETGEVFVAKGSDITGEEGIVLVVNTGGPKRIYNSAGPGITHSYGINVFDGLSEEEKLGTFITSLEGVVPIHLLGKAQGADFSLQARHLLKAYEQATNPCAMYNYTAFEAGTEFIFDTSVMPVLGRLIVKKYKRPGSYSWSTLTDTVYVQFWLNPDCNSDYADNNTTDHFPLIWDY